MLNIGIGIFMSTLDASIVNISLPTIIHALQTNVRTVAWVVTAYLIVVTGCLLLMGSLADVWGQRRIYLLGVCTFTVGSCLCGLSPTIYFLIGSRMIQGLGAASLMANGTAIVSTVFPQNERGQALGMLGSIVSVGFLTGPLLGGFLIEHLGWRWIFFINLPVGIFAVFLSLKTLTRDRPAKAFKPDLWGALFLFVFVSSLLLLLNRVGQRSTPLVWGWLLLCAASFSLFLRVELHAAFPLVDLHLLRRRPFIASLGASLLSFLVSGAHTFVIPFFLQDILAYSPSKVGALVFPVALTVMVMAPLGGRISDRAGVRLPATIGLMVMAGTVFSFTLIKVGAGEYQILLRQVLMGIGIGLFNPANNSAIIGSLPKERVGLASSFLALARNLGLVIGVAFAEMVIAFKSGILGPEAAQGSPSLESIQEVWKWTLLIGLIAVLFSWTRSKKPLEG
jgi:EmrB/QacA subfamily drug resistance transporter